MGFVKTGFKMMTYAAAFGIGYLTAMDTYTTDEWKVDEMDGTAVIEHTLTGEQVRLGYHQGHIVAGTAEYRVEGLLREAKGIAERKGKEFFPTLDQKIEHIVQTIDGGR